VSLEYAICLLYLRLEYNGLAITNALN
jgi:hypothetical protein